MQYETVQELINKSWESISNTIGSIGYIHKTIHDGKNFASEHDFGIVSKGGGTADVLLVNPADNYPHLYEHNFNPDANPGQVEIFEGPTYSDAGTEKDSESLNRVSDNTANMKVYVEPTLDTDGERIDIIGKTTSKNSSDSSVQYVEWVLKPDTDYLIRFTNEATADTTICIAKMAWYE